MYFLIDITLFLMYNIIIKGKQARLPGHRQRTEADKPFTYIGGMIYETSIYPFIEGAERSKRRWPQADRIRRDLRLLQSGEHGILPGRPNLTGITLPAWAEGQHTHSRDKREVLPPTFFT